MSDFDFKDFLEKSIGNDRDKKTQTYGKDINILINSKPKEEKSKDKKK
jgi:flagellar biosynthesis regulator FlaF